MGFLNNLLKKNESSVLGIDISSSSIKIVQLRKKGGRALLETYGEISLGPYGGFEIGRATNLPVEKISEALTDVLREANTTTKRCGMAIPFGASLMTIMEMPSLSTKQLSQMIPIEARKYIPVPISEVLLDWSIIPVEEKALEEDEAPRMGEVDKSKKVDVLVVAIHNETINKYQDIIAKTELSSSFFEIEIFSTIRSVLDQDIAPVMVLDFGASGTKTYIVERGIVRNSHIINRGSQDVTMAISKSLNMDIAKAENIKREAVLGKKPAAPGENISEIVSLTVDHIFSEANRVILNYQKKFNKTINKVVLTGGGVLLKGIHELAKAQFQTEVVKADPFAKVEAPAFLEDILKDAGPEFAVAVGVALRRLQEIE